MNQSYDNKIQGCVPKVSSIWYHVDTIQSELRPIIRGVRHRRCVILSVRRRTHGRHVKGRVRRFCRQRRVRQRHVTASTKV